ncbi:hypothetical protein [Micromonospora sp. DT47]
MTEDAESSDEEFRGSKIDEYLADLREQLLANSYVEPEKYGLRHAP